ncbi:MAG: hypothetical protein GY858_07950 [Candidatus Omnitrophica bacterium]|nr:hypothetical protein [Candidatus Omnitrophota bacterium]
MRKCTKLLILFLCFFCVRGYAENIAFISNAKIPTFTEAVDTAKKYLLTSGYGITADIYDYKDPEFLNKLKAKKYDVICPVGTNATRKVKNAITDTPIVFTMILGAVKSKIISNLGPSGQNITGASLDIAAKPQLELFKRIAPSIKKVGVMYSPGSAAMIADAKKIASSLGIEIVAVEVAVSTQVPKTLRTLVGKIDSLWIMTDSKVCTKDTLPLILNFTLKNKIPAIGFTPYLVKAGALVSYTYDYKDVGKQTGELIGKVLDGKDAGKIAIASPRKVGYVLNLKTAKFLGITIPSGLIRGADETFK